MSATRSICSCPKARAAARPVFMFVHGGGFVRGNKRAPGSPFYDNIMLWATRNGMVGVNMTYRLAPHTVALPAGQEDLAMAVRWAADNAAAHGGDPNRIYLMGHSAGATHVAIYVGASGVPRPRRQRACRRDLLVRRLRPDQARGWRRPQRLFRHRSCALRGALGAAGPASRAPCRSWPTPPSSIRPGWSSNSTSSRPRSARRRAAASRTLLQPKHNHMSQSYAINTADVLLTEPDAGVHEDGEVTLVRFTGIAASPGSAPGSSRRAGGRHARAPA